MPRFRFALSNSSTHQVREAGMVQTETFDDAMTAISEHLDAREGETLEIGALRVLLVDRRRRERVASRRADGRLIAAA